MPEDKKSYTRDAEILKLVISQLNIPASTLSTDLGFSSTYLSSILNGRKGISLEVAKALYEKYNFNLQWVLYGEGEMFKFGKENWNINQSGGNNTASGRDSKVRIGGQDPELLNRINELEKELIRKDTMIEMLREQLTELKEIVRNK